jgi:hypothetical protein
MTLIIGTDEAGYGPNLGPLVVAATAWRVTADPSAAERALAAALTTALADHDGPLWDDSKRIYRGGAGFTALERGGLVAAALATGGLPRSWPAWAAAHGDGPAEPTPETWWLDDAGVPLEADAEECLRLAARIGPRLAAGGAAIVAIRWRVIQPAAFNRLLDLGLNKSDILSQTTLDLAAGLTAGLGDGRTLVWCDRHGGRRRYAGLLARHFAAPLVRVVEETATRSGYELEGAGCRVEFSVGGEARAPVAAASMIAKYVREVAMRAFNAHWSGRHPTIAPTAGYPVDAARWRRQAAAAVAAAGMPWDAVWRRA